MPIFRDAAGTAPNLHPGLLALISSEIGAPVSPEDIVAYLYGILAHPAFVDRFWDELETCELRVPITKEAGLFDEVRDAGAHLLWLHTYGERFVPEGRTSGDVPQGEARCTQPVPQSEEEYPNDFDYDENTQTLRVGGGEFAPVAPEVYAFEVSGYRVVQSWLKNRMREPRGRKSSPLDELRLLWILEATVAAYPRMASLLERVVSGRCIEASDLPAVPDECRKPPRDRGEGAWVDDA
jgi:hypothetical protein